MSEHRTSWNIKDDAVCEELVGILQISAAECAVLKALQPAAEKIAPEMVADFHGRLTAHANTGQFFEGVDVGRVGGLVAAWFKDLFSGEYDAAYAKKRRAIGQAHVRIGLPVRYPLAMFDVVQTHGDRVCEGASDVAGARAAFRKVLALDLAVFNQAFEDNQLKHLAELVGGELLARKLLAGQA